MIGLSSGVGKLMHGQPTPANGAFRQIERRNLA